MKKLLVLMAMLLPLVSFAQQEDAKKQMTKYEEFVSKTGSFIKFTDINMPKVSLSFGSGGLNARIRTFNSESNAHFYRLESTIYKSNVAMIEYSDLVEINKAIVKLASEVEKDIATNPDYMENKFSTVDGFEVGYYIEKGKANWWIRLERFSTNFSIKNESEIVDAFKNAQLKIEELIASGD